MKDDQYIRGRALDIAARSLEGGEDVEDILAVARIFEAYIRGDEKPIEAPGPKKRLKVPAPTTCGICGHDADKHNRLLGCLVYDCMCRWGGGE